jgi:hypothetical protein
MAQYIEIKNWQRTHSFHQIDPAPIYARAKVIDGDNDDGTYMLSVVKAAKDLGLLPISSNLEVIKSAVDVRYALHANQICLLAMRITKGWYNASNINGYILDNKEYVGGHMILGCWYAVGKGFGWQNSWGTSWGVQGFGRCTEAQFDSQFMEAGIIT